MNTPNNIDEILNSVEFNSFFDIDAEQKEIEATGWNYKEMLSFGKQLAKKIK
jgi:hypothetical protein